MTNSSGHMYTVESGDTLSGIARSHGISSWRDIYYDSQNAAFRQQRPDPNHIEPGDEVWLPVVRRNQAVISTGQPVSLVIYGDAPGAVGTVWVRFLSPYLKPLSLVKCTLVGASRQFTAQDASLDGVVAWDDVPLEEYTVRLEVGDAESVVSVPWLRDRSQVHDQYLRDTALLLSPTDSVYGIQVRLNGLGYSSGPIDGIVGPLTRGATERFQEEHGITVDGIAGPVTQQVLVDVFGA